jgi:lipopolysaccharide transport system ATP-binding protein
LESPQSLLQKEHMSKVVIKVENISKQYRLGEVGTGALAHDVNKWWHKVRGKEDPYLKIGETNDRTTTGSSDYVWALKDINFEVNQGEVLGIIGRNGAGKSTLLKILSKTTTPTTGSIKVKGRIASLLEVGTGFHPELSGRDNIFLNGAILGMTKQEIKTKFDEIVDFAGVERYIDTPVKRYSSGMYVRLAFGVAAHLEPEILIVDEVLAVGDAEFQKKALGKMKEVSESGGRTVLFVSHNMAAISSLCEKGLLLSNGAVACKGEVDVVLNEYLKLSKSSEMIFVNENKSLSESITRIQIGKDSSFSAFDFNNTIDLFISIKHESKIRGTTIGVAIKDRWQQKIFTDTYVIPENTICESESCIKVTIPSKTLLSGLYYVDAAIFIPNQQPFEYLTEVCSFEIEDLESDVSGYANNNIGSVYIKYNWHVQ